MINPEDEILVDFRTSCTKEEAVGKLLGWMQGPIRKKYVEVNEQGISSDQLPFIHSLDGSLQEQLIELREAARMDFLKAVEEEAAHDVAQAKEESVIEYDKLIKKAAKYLMEIEDEIAKGETSRLRVDQSTTEKLGIVHITLKSLDQWSQKNYNITILDQFSTNPISENSQVNEAAKDELSKTKAENLYTTFAFLVEAFASSSKGEAYRHADKRPNATTIAEHLEKLALEASGGSLKGQSKESIRKLIKEALRIKQSLLPKKS